MINFLRNSTSGEASNIIQLNMPSPMLGILALSLGMRCMLLLKALGYAGSLLIVICCFVSSASEIDLSKFQKPNDKEFAFVQSLSKELEAKQAEQPVASVESRDTEITEETLDWLKALEDRSQKPGFHGDNLNSSPEFYVFASLGLKPKHLKALVEDARRFSGAVVIRGLKNDSFSETIKYIQSLMKQEQEGVLLDPTLFKKYNITHVPAFVLTHDEQHDIVKGNVTARFALLRMKANGDLKSYAEQKLTNARGLTYAK